MTDVQRRCATPAEAAIFAGWEINERPYPWSTKQFTDVISNSQYWCGVLDINQTPVAFIIVLYVGPEATILNLMVHPTYRRQKLGKQLLDFAQEWAHQHHIKDMFLDVDENNSRAIHLYEHAGFTLQQRRLHSYPRGENALLMGKKL